MQSECGLSLTSGKGHGQLLWHTTALISLQKQRWVKQLLQIKGNCRTAPLTDSLVRLGGGSLKHKSCLPVLAKLLEFPGEINHFSQHEVSKLKYVRIKAENLFFFAEMALKYLHESKGFKGQLPLALVPRILEGSVWCLSTKLFLLVPAHLPPLHRSCSWSFPGTVVSRWWPWITLTSFFISFPQTHFFSLSKSILTSQVQNQPNCRTFYMFAISFT